MTAAERTLRSPAFASWCSWSGGGEGNADGFVLPPQCSVCCDHCALRGSVPPGADRAAAPGTARGLGLRAEGTHQPLLIGLALRGGWGGGLVFRARSQPSLDSIRPGWTLFQGEWEGEVESSYVAR